MDFLAVRGQGDPNQEGGAYKAAIGQLYAVAYTIKMSKLGKHKLEGYFDYVVPPLEGLWWMEGGGAIDFAHKERFHWISMIRLPQFVTRERSTGCAGGGAEEGAGLLRRGVFLPMRTGCASSACTWAPTTGRGRPSGPWSAMRRNRGISWTRANTAATTRSISVMCGRCRPERLKTVDPAAGETVNEGLIPAVKWESSHGFRPSIQRQAPAGPAEGGERLLRRSGRPPADTPDSRVRLFPQNGRNSAPADPPGCSADRATPAEYRPPAGAA